MSQIKSPSNGFMCYFCNEFIRNATRTGHASVCSNVLTPCPNKCGAYVCRKDLRHHENQCANTRINNNHAMNGQYQPQVRGAGSLDRRVNFAQQYHPPADSVQDMMTAIQQNIGSLSQRLSAYERKQSASTGNLAYQNDQIQEVERLKLQNQMMNEWKQSVEYKIANLKDTVLTFERTKNEQQIHLMNIDQKLDKFHLDLNSQIEAIVKERSYNDGKFAEFMNLLSELRNCMGQDRASIDSLLDDQKEVLNRLHNEIEEFKLVFSEQKAKISALSFDIKSVTHLAGTTEEKLEIQEREFKEMKNQLEQLRFDFEILESLASGETGIGAPITSPGHIIWKISCFDDKMTKAKENDTLIKSQTFYSHDFGYKLRVICYLNGLRKWKDRYALISLHVLKGEYDSLLKWPCHLEGTITLRDLENVDAPSNFTKTITAKRQMGDEESEEPQESSNSYIFIAHRTLLKPIYKKDDCIYLDVRIRQENLKLKETML